MATQLTNQKASAVIFLADATGGASRRPTPQVRLPRPTWGAAFPTLASRRMRALCETIPQRLFDRLAVALFGTHIVQNQQPGGSSGVDDLEACLLGRGCELVLAPLQIELPADRAFRSSKALGPADLRRVKEFAADLWEASVPAPLI